MIQKNSEKGIINITPEVFTNIVGDTASSCFGVKGMASRKDNSWQLLRRESMSKGVNVVFDDEKGCVSVELHIIVNHGVNIAALSESIVKEVSYKVTASTGVIVSRVDVFIDSMDME